MSRGTVVVVLLATLLSGACMQRESTSPTPQQSAAQSTGTETHAAPPSTATVGQMMPKYAADLLGGGTFDVEKERGTVVLLNVWATWCGPCRYEIPELEALHKQYASQRFKVVGVSIDESGAESVRQFVTGTKGMTYPIALDPEGKLATIFETTVIPTTVLIDRSGKIVWKRLGAIEARDETLVKALSAALAHS